MDIIMFHSTPVPTFHKSSGSNLRWKLTKTKTDTKTKTTKTYEDNYEDEHVYEDNYDDEDEDKRKDSDLVTFLKNSWAKAALWGENWCQFQLAP